MTGRQVRPPLAGSWDIAVHRLVLNERQRMVAGALGCLSIAGTTENFCKLGGNVSCCGTIILRSTRLIYRDVGRWGYGLLPAY